MNAVFERNSINFTLRTEGSKVEPIKLDGPRAKKIIACHEELIDSIVPPDTPKPRQQFWRDCMLKVWKQWQTLDEMFQQTDFAVVKDYDFEKEARRLGLYWAQAFTSQFMGANYLHIVVFHTGQYWDSIRYFNMTFGVFSSSGLERRHVSKGRPAHDKVFKMHDVGRKRKDGLAKNHDVALDVKNRVQYLTLRELWLSDWIECNTLCTQCQQWR